jgi:SAM-dependent methyltransferase
MSGPDPAVIAELRPAYQADLAAGTDRFFRPRRDDCPWCGGTDLSVALRTTDLLQIKPGRFTVAACADCGHLFQNPRLSGAGLEFYYRDFYDGLGAEGMARLFAGQSTAYRHRAELLRPYPTPRNWLDVGTGHGHFCHTARESWPDTRFEGLDQCGGVERAAEHGWIDRAHRAEFIAVGPTLADGYDVVSMYHYLEHTTDPAAELETAYKVLRPGGHLLIELPNPGCRWRRLLGRYWVGWLQPQHLQLFPLDNLRRRLAELGFTVRGSGAVDSGYAFDLVAAVWLGLCQLAPAEDAPWRARRPGRAARWLRSGIFIAGLPPLAVAALVDRFARPTHGLRWSAAYWIVAGKD